MRVAIDARSLSERYTSNRTYWEELVRALGRLPEIELLLVSNRPLPREGLPAGAKTIVASVPGRWFSLITLPKIAREEGADVVHVQYTVSPFFRSPVVTTVHDVSFFIEPAWFGLKDRLLLRWTVPAACRRAARVVAVSETCREEILAYVDVPPEKVAVTLEGAPSRLREVVEGGVLDWTLGRPYVLLVGGASPRKNLDGAYRAVLEARKTIPDLILLATGRIDPAMVDPIVVLPQSLEEGDLKAAYLGAYALLHPSFHEGFGLTILEAMSLGCPVVASDRGSIPEIAGDGAILCDADDVAAMADALVRLLNPALRGDMVARGHARAAGFTWDATAEATVRAYRAAIDP